MASASATNGLARALNVTPARINEIVRERRGISVDTSLRLARFFKTDVQSWIDLQANYDLQCAEDAAGLAIAKIRPYVDNSARLGPYVIGSGGSILYPLATIPRLPKRYGYR